ncbi:MAG TPA: TolC family protein [Candidatus Binataceae bacterium]|nr:TolC family protein [Candidatus Binataceae bacterium]
MLSPARALTITLALMLMQAAVSSAANETLQNRILTPIGPPTAPVSLKVPATVENYLNSGKARPLPSLPIRTWVTFSDFVHLVEEDNLALAAQRYNVSIADAHLTAAYVYPDPTLQGGYIGDINEDQSTGYNGQVTATLVLGGRLRYGVQAARANLEASRAGLADYIRTLRGQAADAFIDALTGRLKLERDIKSLQRAQQLVEFNAQALGQKQASQDALMRSRIAAAEAYSNLANDQSALHQTLGNLAVFMGTRRREGLIGAEGSLERPVRTFSLEELVEKAVTSRTDVVAAQYNLDSAIASYHQAKAQRIPDLAVSGVYNHFTRITNPIDPAPPWNSAGVLFSVPLPFSDLNKGAVAAAYYTQLQAEKTLQATRLQAEDDVRTAYEQYTLAIEQTELFGAELLKDSDQSNKQRLFRLEKGLATLTDVLDSHAALDQLYTDYYNALSNRAKALVALEQAAGIWDLNF